MQILIAWDNAPEAELLQLYLAAGDNTATVTLTPDEALARIHQSAWDVLLLALPPAATADQGFAQFQQLRRAAPGLPVVLACRDTEMISLPRFLTHGLRSYLIRDRGGDFIFLALSALEAALAAARAEETRRLADRLREEMEGVRRLQESIIPRGVEPPAGYRIAARYEPSEVSVVGDRPVIMAGGDYYDLFRPDERTLVVLLGDASGHGLKACMAIMTMHTLIRMIPGDRYRATAAFVTEINQRLCENSIVQSEGGFVTLFYAAIDTVTHTMTWTSAGHPLPLLQSLETGEVMPLGDESGTGMPLGIAPGLDYPAASVVLPPASRVLLYTDGLSDAFPLEGSAPAFGVQGIRATMHACRESDLEQALQQLLAASHACTGGSGRHDDTSLMLVERCPCRPAVTASADSRGSSSLA